MHKPFAERILIWFDQYGRKDLPWQDPITPYRVWISEIMLQQTQVVTVIPYYKKFMESFPDLHTLANASTDDVLKHWSGLGYYARARNLHKAAQQIRDEFNGKFPETLEEVVSLSGIGRSTAGAILSIAFQQRQAILDGNVKRVLARHNTIDGWHGQAAIQKELWGIAEDLLPHNVPQERHAHYTQAMMDLGATLCTRSKPNCPVCPIQEDCKAFLQNVVAQYPVPKPKKVIPQRSAVMLLIYDNSHIYLEKRPDTGIWGGLWCFPQFDSVNDAKQWLMDNGYQSEAVDMASALPNYKHVFSHFKLTLTPLLINQKISQSCRVRDTDDIVWYNINHEFNGGLATPVQDLLMTFKELKL